MELSPDPLATRRFELRPFKKRDIEPLLDAVNVSLADLYVWLPWAHRGYSRVDATRFVKETMRSWREQRAYDFAIRADEDPGRHIGNVSIWFISRGFRSGEIGYWIRSDMAGGGVATEVTARMVEVGFEDLRMHRIVLRIAVGNRASERVAEKLGFVREGILREELEVHGKWLDHTVYSMLEHEYQAQRDRIAAWAG